MLIGANGKAAGDFSLYGSRCDLFKAGWKLFRPEAYDFNLVLEGRAPNGEDDVIVDDDQAITNIAECPDEEEDTERRVLYAPLPTNS